MKHVIRQIIALLIAGILNLGPAAAEELIDDRVLGSQGVATVVSWVKSVGQPTSIPKDIAAILHPGIADEMAALRAPALINQGIGSYTGYVVSDGSNRFVVHASNNPANPGAELWWIFDAHGKVSRAAMVSPKTGTWSPESEPVNVAGRKILNYIYRKVSKGTRPRR